MSGDHDDLALTSLLLLLLLRLLLLLLLKVLLLLLLRLLLKLLLLLRLLLLQNCVWLLCWMRNAQGRRFWQRGWHCCRRWRRRRLCCCAAALHQCSQRSIPLRAQRYPALAPPVLLVPGKQGTQAPDEEEQRHNYGDRTPKQHDPYAAAAE